MATVIQNLLSIITTELKVLLVSMVPVIELRGAIPMGISMGMSPFHALFVSILGSMIPVPFIIFGVRPLFKWLRKTKTFRKFVNQLTHKAAINGQKIQKYGFWGLILLVAIPLPGTGVWSGTLAAAFLDIRIKSAFPAILIGNIIAGLIVTAVSIGLL